MHPCCRALLVYMDHGIPSRMHGSIHCICRGTGNNRGNRYSHKHVSLSPHEDEYWNFSIDELARYDLPCMVDYVLAYTNEAQLRYIG